MPPYGTDPDWATPGDTSAPAAPPAPQAIAATGGVEATGGGDGSSSSGDSGGSQVKCILVMVSCLNFGISAMMAALGVLTLLTFNGSSLTDIASTPFLASYMILFSALLFFYELMWWMPVPGINMSLRKNFGFMYGLKGKGLYMIFVAFLCLGLMDESNNTIRILGWATGIAFLATGVLHFFLVFSNPKYMDAYRPPTAGLERMSETGVETQAQNAV